MPDNSNKKAILVALAYVTPLALVLYISFFFPDDSPLKPIAILAYIVFIIIGSVTILIYHQLKDPKPEVSTEVGSEVKEQLAAMGYEYISERRLTFSEKLYYMDWELLAGNKWEARGSLPEMKRIFHIRTEEQYEFELVTEIRKAWPNKIMLTILKAIRLEQ